MPTSLTINSADGAFSCFLARPDVAGNYPVIVVLQEIFGVNPNIRSVVESYAAKGYIALAPDLFWRSEPNLALSPSVEADRTRAFALLKALDLELAMQDIRATIEAARTLDGSTGRVGVVGFCLGGLLAFLCAARTQADACAAYYGGRTDQYLAEAAHITKPLLLHLGAADEIIGATAQQQIQVALAPLQDAEVHIYSGRGHAFARPGSAHYDEADARLANRRTDEFFARTLR